MLDLIKVWYEKHFSDPQVVILALVILSGIAIILFTVHRFNSLQITAAVWTTIAHSD